MPGRLAVGKKVTACDQCAQSKRACDSKAPCSICTVKHQACTYERQKSASKPQDQKIAVTSTSHGENEPASEFNYDFLDDLNLASNSSFQNPTEEELLDWDWNIPLGSPYSDESPDPAQIQNYSLQPNSGFDQLPPNKVTELIRGNSAPQGPFDFLLHFTRTTGLRATFNYKRQRCHTAVGLPQESSATFNSANILEEESFTTARQLRKDQENVRVSLVSFIEYLDDPLFAQTKSIWDSFRVSRIRTSQNILLSTEEAEASDERCLQFFSPSNLRRFIRLFWDEWYPHCPIIHRPTFDLLSVPPLLLVPMAVIGACMSPIPQEINSGKRWLDFTEELVFSHPLLSAEAIESDVSESDMPPLRVLQAAYVTCILLNWEGSDTMKRRVRHHRFNAVVSVRTIRLTRRQLPIDELTTGRPRNWLGERKPFSH